MPHKKEVATNKPAASSSATGAATPLGRFWRWLRAALPANSPPESSTSIHANSVDTAPAALLPPELTQQLEDSSWVVRREAVGDIARYPADAALPYLQTALNDPDSSVRLAAVRGLGQYNTPTTNRMLVKALYDKDVIVIDAAANLLKTQGADAVEDVVVALEGTDINARGAAAEILHELAAPQTAPRLIVALADSSKPWMQNERVCDIAARALEKINTAEARKAVSWWRALQEQQQQEKDELATHGELFVDVGNVDSGDTNTALPQVSADPNETQNALPDAPPLQQEVGRLLATFNDTTWGSREQAAKHLQKLIRSRKGAGEANAPMLAPLVEKLQHDEWEVRHTVVEALSLLEVHAAVPHLLPLLKDSHWMVRGAAVRGLAEYRDEETLNQLCVMLGDTNAHVREAAAEAVGAFQSPDAIPSLRWVMNDDSPHVRLALVEALHKIGEPDVLPMLLKTAFDADVNVRWASVRALEYLGDANSVPILKLCLEDTTRPFWEEQRVCDLAASALKRVGTPEAQIALQQWKPDDTAEV